MGTGLMYVLFVASFARRSANSFPGILACPLIHVITTLLHMSASESTFRRAVMPSLLVEEAELRACTDARESVSMQMLAPTSGSERRNEEASEMANISAWNTVLWLSKRHFSVCNGASLMSE